MVTTFVGPIIGSWAVRPDRLQMQRQLQQCILIVAQLGRMVPPLTKPPGWHSTPLRPAHHGRLPVCPFPLTSFLRKKSNILKERPVAAPTMVILPIIPFSLWHPHILQVLKTLTTVPNLQSRIWTQIFLTVQISPAHPILIHLYASSFLHPPNLQGIYHWDACTDNSPTERCLCDPDPRCHRSCRDPHLHQF